MQEISPNSPHRIHSDFHIVLTAQELLALVMWAPPDPLSIEYRDSLIIGLLASSGLRRAGILGLTTRNLQVVSGRPWLVDFAGKGLFVRSVPLLPSLYSRLVVYLQAGNSRFSGTSLLHQHRCPWSFLSRSIIWKIVKKRTLELVGLSVRPHLLRHSIATVWLQSGVDIKTVQLLLGHRSLSSTSKYLHTSPDRLIAAVDSLFAGPSQLSLFSQPSQRPQFPTAAGGRSG